jgi:putative hemolysin
MTFSAMQSQEVAMLVQVTGSDHQSSAANVYPESAIHLISNFKAKVRMFFEKSGYFIKTADAGGELFQALRLRHNVFYKELLDKNNTIGIDIDEFDPVSDHLILIDKNTNFIVGTYRLNSTMYANRFYSEKEFDLANIMKLFGIKLELGRACILKEHRNGVTIVLLFMGIYEYMKIINAKYLFGCSSMNTGDYKKIAVVYRYLRDRYMTSDESRAFSLQGYAIANFSGFMRDLEKSGYDLNYESARRMTPSLIGAYLQLGAKICGEPAYDPDFKCADFLTLLDIKDLDVDFMNTLFSNAG